MSEPKSTDEAITFQEFVDFLRDVKATSPCTACGKQGWVVLTGEPDMMARLSLDGQEGRGIGIYSAYCSHCGMVRSHVESVVRKWKKDRDAGEECQAEEQAGNETDEPT